MDYLVVPWLYTLLIGILYTQDLMPVGAVNNRSRTKADPSHRFIYFRLLKIGQHMPLLQFVMPAFRSQ